MGDARDPAAGIAGTDTYTEWLYESLRNLAAARLARQPPGQTLEATALVHEVWVRLRKQEQQQWLSRAHFFAAAALAMRNILVERARARRRVKRGRDFVRATFTDAQLEQLTVDYEAILTVNDALEALEAVSADAARVAAMRYFGGMEMSDIAAALDTSVSTVERRWRLARSWLRDYLEAP